MFKPPEFLAQENYKFIKVLADYGKRLVCLYHKVETDEICVVKFDPSNEIDASFIKECVFLKANHKNTALTSIPKFYEHGKTEGRRYIVF